MKMQIVLLMATVLVACGKTSIDTRAESESAALALISAEAIRKHATYLADDALGGREHGEQGYTDAAAYVAEQLEAMGVMPGGDNDGWYQQVTLRQGLIDTARVSFTIHRDDEDTVLRYRDEFAMGADILREDASVRGEVVYVGFGVHAPEFGYSDYDGIDVTGKIVALFAGAPATIEGNERAYYASGRNKQAEAVRRGAIGVISLTSREDEARRSWDESKARFGKRPQSSWVNGAGEAAGYFPQLAGSAYLSIAAAEQLFAESALPFSEALDANEKAISASTNLAVEVTLSRHSDHSDATSPNVIGLVRGTDPELADEYIIYTAHLDHLSNSSDEDDEDKIHNGFYDNAMGVALMLETARAFVAAPPRRSVLFIALTAEEKGLLGSDYFANNPTVPAEAMVANINLDMPLFLYPLADLIAFGSQHSSLQAITELAAAEEQFTFSPDPIPEENLFVRSDQYSFVRQGVPAVFLVPGFQSTSADIDGESLFREHLKNHYHEPSDDVSLTVEWDSALRFARAHTRIGFLLGMEDDRPTWNEGDFFGERYGKKAL